MDGKTIAVLSYIFLIGWIIAFVLHQNDKTEIGAYHLRQSLGLNLLGLILAFIPIIGWILSLLVFVFWILGLVSAVQGEMKPVPLLGDFFQDIFKGID